MKSEYHIDKCPIESRIGTQYEECSRWRSITDEIRNEYLSKKQKFPWIVGFSGGKDSTVLVHAIFEALLSIAPSKRKRSVHIVSNDTLVESPLVISHLDKVTCAISTAVKNLSLPIVVARTKPDIQKTFWSLLIGKGYPSPNQTMRWCTDRLKIQPTSSYIKNQVSSSGSAIVVLGVRNDESQARARSIEKHVNETGQRLTPHTKLIGAYVYRPIVNMTTSDVWDILLCEPAPWGGMHKDIVQLYKDAEGGECPVMLDDSSAPSCGTTSSRFGCWTCTVVEKDKSLQGFIDSGKNQYQPLVEFRDWLKQIRNDPTMRSAVRRNGKVAFSSNGKQIPGPFTIQARKIILTKLLEAQATFGASLILHEEIEFIHDCWAQELATQRGVLDGLS